MAALIPFIILASILLPAVDSKASFQENIIPFPAAHASDDGFGYAVDVDTATAVIGSPAKSNAAANDGVAYVYTNTGATWRETQLLAAPDAAADDRFGTSVSLSNDLIVVGAPYDDDKGSNSGSAYVFRFDGTTWAYEQKLTASAGAAGDYFGLAVAVHQGTIIVGAYGSDQSGYERGALLVYSYNGTAWVETSLLATSGPPALDNYGLGYAVAFDETGGALIAGARGSNGHGAAYVFRNSNGSWAEEGKLTSLNNKDWDYFGGAVAIHGDLAIVGSTNAYHTAGGTALDGTGAAYVFRKSGDGWNEERILTAGDAVTGQHFGDSVHIDSGKAIIGAPERFISQAIGSVYVFHFDGAGWSQSTKIVPSDGAPDGAGRSYLFGDSLALSGGTLLVNAGLNTPYSQGEVYAYSLCDTIVTSYRDADNDGYGDSGAATDDCLIPPGYVGNAMDCDDSDAAIHPGGAEICDNVDQNCDSLIDEGFATRPYYRDYDNDSFGNPDNFIQKCLQLPGYTADATDCDDTNAAAAPSAGETCDGIDNNCDGQIDEVFSGDCDGDGVPRLGGDCDDGNPAVNPGATEVCDFIDNNCDGQTDEGFIGDCRPDGHTVAYRQLGDGNGDDWFPAINRQGDIVWHTFYGTHSEIRLFRSDTSETVTLYSGWTTSLFPAINNSREIVWDGDIDTTSGYIFEYSIASGSIQTIASNGYAPSINDNGDMVWHNTNAVFFRDRQTGLISQFVPYYTGNVAYEGPRINNRKDIVWRSWDPAADAAQLYYRDGQSGEVLQVAQAKYISDIQLNQRGDLAWSASEDIFTGQIYFFLLNAEAKQLQQFSGTVKINDNGDILWTESGGTYLYTYATDTTLPVSQFGLLTSSGKILQTKYNKLNSTYELYSYDPTTATTTQMTNLEITEFFNGYPPVANDNIAAFSAITKNNGPGDSSHHMHSALLRGGCLPTAEMCDDGSDNDCDGIIDNGCFPLCGDGRLDGNEQCDDGNRDDGDACSSSCQPTTPQSKVSTQISHNTSDDWGVSINNSGDMVWVQYPGKVFFHNGTTGQTTQIGFSTTWLLSAPKMNSRGNVSWIESTGDILFYEKATGSTHTINGTANTSRRSLLLNDNDAIAWTEMVGTVWDIYLSGYPTGTPVMITNNSAVEQPVDLNNRGDILFSTDAASGIHLYNGSRGLIVQISAAPTCDYAGSFPLPPGDLNNNGKVAWPLSDGNDCEIFLYDADTDSLGQITDNTFLDGPALINDLDQVAWFGQNDSDGELFVSQSAGGNRQITSDSMAERSETLRLSESGELIWIKKDLAAGLNSLHSYRYDTDTVALISDNVSDSSQPAINDFGTIAWNQLGLHDRLESEIFTNRPSPWRVAAGTGISLTPTPLLSLTFDQVSQEGILSFAAVPVSHAGLTTIGNSSYELSFSGSFLGQVTVCLSYDDSGIVDETALQLLHWTGAIWEDITTQPVDSANNRICGRTDSLSPFIIVEPGCVDADRDGYSPTGGECGIVDCNDSQPNVNPGIAEICSDNLDNDCNIFIDDGCDPANTVGMASNGALFPFIQTAYSATELSD